MEISPFGYFLIPIGTLLFIIGRKYLFWTFIISLAFFNTSILYIDSISFFLRTPFFFMTLLIIRKSMDICVSGHTQIYKSKENIYLFLFIFIAGLSLIMPLYIDGNIMTFPYGGGLYPIRIEPLYFTLTNITQYIYLIFGALSFLILGSELNSLERIKKVFKVSIFLGILVILVGLSNMLLRVFGYTGTSENIFYLLGASDISFRNKYVLGIPQMYSITGEPGYIASYLLFIFGMVAIPIMLRKKSLLIKNWTVPIFTFIFVGLMATLSTKAYMGIIILLISLLFMSLHLFKPAYYFKHAIRIIFLIFIAIIFIYFLFDTIFRVSFVDVIYKTLISKLMLESGSGALRWFYIVENFKQFLQYPLLGLGIGSTRSTSLIMGLLANLGILGTIFFLLFNGHLFCKMYRIYVKSNQMDQKVFLLSIIISYLSLFGVMLIGVEMGTSFIFLYYWLLMAIMSSFSLNKMEMHKQGFSSRAYLRR